MGRVAAEGDVGQRRRAGVVVDAAAAVAELPLKVTSVSGHRSTVFENAAAKCCRIFEERALQDRERSGVVDATPGAASRVAARGALCKGQPARVIDAAAVCCSVAGHAACTDGDAASGHHDAAAVVGRRIVGDSRIGQLSHTQVVDRTSRVAGSVACDLAVVDV